MNRRTFLAAAGAALAGGIPLSLASAAPPVAASTSLEMAASILGTPYRYGGNDIKNGIDCSAYVSWIWKIPRQSTDTIHAWSFKIGVGELMPGDVMNLPYVGRRSHCRVFAGWATESRTAVWVYEAARQIGVAYRVIRYNPEYTPIRRYDFVRDVPQPEPGLPIDHPVAGGHFYSQTGAMDGMHGFAIVDNEEARLFSAFRFGGGVDTLGFPISRRILFDDSIVQLTERAMLRWLVSERRSVIEGHDVRLAIPGGIDAHAPQVSPLALPA
ncbi:MAG: NlpC/P60 family protein [Chloroflexi bacterium]|nr:NlpC/P60 family protein [Chloroflexota bacterium]